MGKTWRPTVPPFQRPGVFCLPDFFPFHHNMGITNSSLPIVGCGCRRRKTNTCDICRSCVTASRLCCCCEGYCVRVCVCVCVGKRRAGGGSKAVQGIIFKANGGLECMCVRFLQSFSLTQFWFLGNTAIHPPSATGPRVHPEQHQRPGRGNPAVCPRA